MIKKIKIFLVSILWFFLNKKNIGDNGERVVIEYYNMNYDKFSIFQKSHYKRYEFAQKQLKPYMIVGDFACGSRNTEKTQRLIFHAKIF
jgi:hypothetical protein